MWWAAWSGDRWPRVTMGGERFLMITVLVNVRAGCVVVLMNGGVGAGSGGRCAGKWWCWC